MKIKSKDQTFFNYLLENYPANEFRWSKTRILTLHQGVFLAYGIEPGDNDENAFQLLHFEKFLKEVDEFLIFELSMNAIQAGTLPMYDKFHIDAKDFVGWAKKIKIPIRTEFFYEDLPNESIKQKANIRARRPDNEELRKKIMGLMGQITRNREEKEVAEGKRNKASSKADYTRNKDMLKLIEIINKLGGLEPVQGDIDPEWFKDLEDSRNIKNKPTK